MLGWVLFGGTQKNNNLKTVNYLMKSTPSDNLSDQLDKFWKIESTGTLKEDPKATMTPFLKLQPRKGTIDTKLDFFGNKTTLNSHSIWPWQPNDSKQQKIN